MAGLKSSEEVDARCFRLKAKLEKLRNPVPKPLAIPKTPQLTPGASINRDLAHLSFHREHRTMTMMKQVAEKHGITVTHVYRLLKVYEDTHTLEFPGYDPSNHWKKVMATMETGVASNGNRRVAPVKHQL